MKNEQDVCPICTEAFEDGEVLIEYLTWNKGKRLGHVDCVLYLSEQEKRKHPPKAKN